MIGQHARRVFQFFMFLLLTTFPAHLSAFRDLKVGEIAPEFNLLQYDGKMKHLGGNSDSATRIIIFWASWSKRSLLAIDELLETTQQTNIPAENIFAVNVDGQELSQEQKDVIQNLHSGRKQELCLLWDDGLQAFSAYGVIAVPSIVVMDSTASIRALYSGYSEKCRKEIAILLGPTVLQTNTGLKPSGASSQIFNSSAVRYYNLGKRLFEQEKFSQTERMLLRAIREDSLFVKPRILLSKTLCKLGNQQNALTEINQVLRIQPSSSTALWQKAEILENLSRAEESTQLYRELLSRNPQFSTFTIALARSLLKQNNIIEAEQLVISLEQNCPHSNEYILLKAMLAEKKGNTKQAAELLRGLAENQTGYR